MFAVLHLPDYALQAVQRTAPVGPVGGAAALFSGSKKKSVVLAANPAARATGVEIGMTAPQAIARCPALLIRTSHPAAEAEARAALLAVGGTLAPTVEDTAPGICTVDLRGADPARYETAARAAIAQLAALALTATAGIARTPLLALYAAREAAADPAPIASALPGEPFLLGEPGPETPSEERKKQEAGAGSVLAPRVIAPADEAAFLAPLPLATAGPPPELAAVLATWGLRTLGDLTALPRDEIVRRFGAAGLALWRHACGGDPHPLHPIAPPREFSAAFDFPEPVETLEPLLFLLRRFLDRLALELQAAQLVAAELALTLQLEAGPPHARCFRLPEPTADAGILFRALHTHLESLQTAAPITGLQLRAAPVRPLVRQQGLFETGLRDPHGFAETLARVSALVGADRVGTPQPEDSHRPDAVRLTPPPAVVPPPAAPPAHPLSGLPLRRFRPPLPARLEFTSAAASRPSSRAAADPVEAGRRSFTLASAPRTAPPATLADTPSDDRRPTYVWTERFQGAITAVRGPWCSSGNWWQSDRAWARMEWDIALAGGGLYRLLRRDEAWFIEGEYD